MWRRIRIAILLAPALAVFLYGVKLLPIWIPITDLRAQRIHCPEDQEFTLDLRIFPPWHLYLGREPLLSLWPLDGSREWILVLSDSLGRANVTHVPPDHYRYSWGTGQGDFGSMEIEAVGGRTLHYQMREN
jgi:hypothetical protein